MTSLTGYLLDENVYLPASSVNIWIWVHSYSAKRRTALGRYAEPEEVAHGTLNFCLPASQYMTGAVLPVDGGLDLHNWIDPPANV